MRFPRTIAFRAQEASDTNEVFELMGAERSAFRVTGMAGFLGVPAGFSAWLSRAPSRRAFTAERIESKVARFHGDCDECPGHRRSWPTCAATRGHLP